MTVNPSADQAIQAVAEALLREKKILVAAHIKPDGDALGCLIAVHRAMQKIGADSLMYLPGDTIAPEYLFLSALSEAVSEPPEDVSSRTLIAVDCGNAERIGSEELLDQSPRIINIDHHSDNSRFGEVNLVDGDASSTAEIIYSILGKMGVEIDREIAEALYTGILVDSGRFQYGSTSPTTFRVAADLIESGVDHTDIYHNVYESIPVPKARLLCRMLDNVTIGCGGQLATGILEQEDFGAADAGPELTDGLINHLRELDGVRVAALIYAMEPDEESDRPHYRVSLRSSGKDVDVQKIAKAKGGGGHTQAAGFSSSGETAAELAAFLLEQVSKDLG